MGIEREIEKRIEKKQQEITALETQLSQAKAHLEGLLEGFKLIQRSPQASDSDDVTLRDGSDVAKARDFLEKTKGAFHINDILKGIGKPVTRGHRVSLAAQMSNYARRNAFFIKVGPNKFALTGYERPAPPPPVDDLPF